MLLERYYLGCLAHASYLIADEKSGIAAVVDPQRNTAQYLRDREEGPASAMTTIRGATASVRDRSRD